jgi:phosphatidylserine/phosphatidylglycerophosphate/cardiolipin synthase-like enzyme
MPSTDTTITMKIVSKLVAGLLAGLAVSHAIAAPYWVPIVQQAQLTHRASAPTTRENWYGFSPDGIGMPLVLYGIYSARQSIHVLSYVLTNRDIIAALAEKAREGVPVTVVVDYGESIAKDRGGYIRKGLDYLARSGVKVCSSNAYKIMHDKDMVLDGRSVQTGSINYTGSGERANSEDAVLAWNDLETAAGFEQHFQSRLATCQPIGE